jgi:hypothetical protein
MKKRGLCFLLTAVLILGFVFPVLGDDVYVVRDGDVLWRIARDHDMTWEELAEYNQLRNPHFIRVGQELLIPVASTELTEYEVIVGGDTLWPVGGTLTVPAGASSRNPVPAVVLVHGSGPSDRDATVYGVNRPFYDIAEYLTANGIAVLRYDNRNYVHGAEMQEVYGPAFSVWEETIEPALSAAELLRNDPRIDRVYIAGLSLGGMLAPRIHAEGGGFDGFILMAASPRTLMDIILDQNWMSVELAYFQLAFQVELLLNLAEAEQFDFLRMILSEMADTAAMTDEEVLALVSMVIDEIAFMWEGILLAVDGLEALFAAVPEMTAEEAQAILFDPTIGMYLYYLWEMAQHPTAELLNDIDAPFLIMQGDNDLQVFAEVDFVLFYEIMGDRDDVTFLLYEGLNHLFMPSVADDLAEAMEEYTIPAQVHPQVLSDMVEWILAQK